MAATPPDAPAYFKLPGVNLFASGEYRGKRWTAADVRKMAENANLLGPGGSKLLIPPAAPGHEDDDGWQEFVGRTDEPAAGWVDPRTVRAVPDPANAGEAILQGDVVNVPAEMADKIRSGEYRFGSAEVYDDFLDDFGKSHGKTLRKFSYLGAEVPQVKRLGPLPRPVPMAAPVKFAERPGVRISVRTVRRGGTVLTFAETLMDRQSMIAAIQAAMPGLAQATLDAMPDDALADLVKNLPTAASPPVATPPVAPSGMMADMSHEDLVAALTDLGEDPADLEGMDDEELQALYDELSADDEAGEAGDTGGGDAATMADDPAGMTRDDLIAALTSMGQDATALQPMSDDDLRALYQQLAGGAAAATPDATMADPPGWSRAGKPKMDKDGFMVGVKRAFSERGVPVPGLVEREARKTLRNFRKLNVFAERQNARLLKSAREAKKRDVDSFCEQLVRAEKATPAQVASTVKPLLMKCDDTLPVYRFSEGGVTRKLTEYELKKAELLKGPKVVHFGERLGGLSPADARSRTAAEVNKVEKFAEAFGSHLRMHGSDPKKLVETAKKMAERDENFTAASLIGKDAAGMTG